MRRIDSRTVEFTEAEQVAKDYFEDYLSRGYSIPFAAKLALNRAQHQTGIVFTYHFAHYLSDGTVEHWGIRWRVQTGVDYPEKQS